MYSAVTQGLAQAQQLAKTWGEINVIYGLNSAGFEVQLPRDTATLGEHIQGKKTNLTVLWEDVRMFVNRTHLLTDFVNNMEQLSSKHKMPLHTLSFCRQVLKKSEAFLKSHFGVTKDVPRGKKLLAPSSLPPKLAALSRRQLQAEFQSHTADQELALSHLKSELTEIDYLLAQTQLNGDMVHNLLQRHARSATTIQELGASAFSRKSLQAHGLTVDSQMEQEEKAAAADLQLPLFPSQEALKYMMYAKKMQEEAKETFHDQTDVDVGSLLTPMKQLYQKRQQSEEESVPFELEVQEEAEQATASQRQKKQSACIFCKVPRCVNCGDCHHCWPGDCTQAMSQKPDPPKGCKPCGSK